MSFFGHRAVMLATAARRRRRAGGGGGGGGGGDARAAGAMFQLKVQSVVDSGAVNDQALTDWLDSTGNGLTPTQVGAGARPKFQTNPSGFGPVVLFELDDFFLWADGLFSALTEGEIFVVCAKVENNPPGDQYTGLWNFGNVTDGTHYPFGDGNIYESFGTTVRKSFARPVTMNTMHVYNVLSAAGEFTARFNDTQLHTTASNTVGFLSTNVRFGESKDSYYLRAYVKEVLMFATKRTAPERAAIKAELYSTYTVTP